MISSLRASLGKLALATASLLALATPIAQAQTYDWKNVQIRGGGFITGLLFHPAEQHLLYARTDVGGAYRWNPANSTWIPLNDDIGIADNQLTGVLSFAVDPADTNRLYLACGQYTASWARNAAILRSADRGATWTRTELPAVKLGGNEDGRAAGERLQVDPNLGTTLYLGTSANGLWRSADRGATWTQLTAFTPAAVNFVLLDQRSSPAGTATRTIYVGVATTTAASLWRSTDAGATWTAVPGAPSGLMPNHAELDGAGKLYLSYANARGPNGMTAGALWRYDTATSAWANISPRASTASDLFGYGAVSVSASAPGTLVATTNDRWGSGDEIWRSADSGATWTNLNPLDSYDASSAPWILNHGTAAAFRPHWMCDVDIDPFNPNRVLFVTGAGLWGADNAFGSAPLWTYRNTGIEETVPIELVSPPSGAPLVSAIGDIGGFRHDNLDTPGAYHNPAGGTNRSLDFAQAVPSFLVRTYAAASCGAYSTDGAVTWTPFPSFPAGTTPAGSGRIAVNANATALVWIPASSVPHWSADRGVTWTASTGVPAGSFRPVFDRVNPNKCYVCDTTAGRVYLSTDAGRTFVAGATVPTGALLMRAVYGHEGHLWLPYWSGLYRSTDSGLTFTKITTVSVANAVGFGAPAPGQTHPAIYLAGTVGGVEGLYRSDDIAATWTRINDNAHRWGLPMVITGDPRTYGRVYYGTNGRGILCGSLPNAAPAVTLTAPADNATFIAGDAVNLSANATDADGTVANVAFYNGTALLATDTAAPFAYSWNNVAAGTYILTALATDDDGASAASAAVEITVNPNARPSVALTSPAAGAAFTAPATVTLSANAADSDGTVAQVSFYNGSTLLATDTAAPYSYSWTNVAAGTYSVTAVAFDNRGSTATAPAVSITVNAPNAAPTVSLTAPADGAVSTAPANVTLTADAADSDGTVASVAFYNGSTLLATDTAAPYSYSWTNVAAGSYTLTARATDNSGAVTTSAAVSFTANARPTVALSSPAAGATFTAPASVTVTANAADSDGTIAKVSFYNGSALLGTVTAAPFTYAWTNVPAGTYSLTAVAFDNHGTTATAPAVSITVNPAPNAAPTVSLTAPASGATYTAPASVTITATASDSDGTVASVAFYNGSTLLGTDTSAPYSYSWTNVAAGSYSLTARATDNSGAVTTSAARSITVSAPNVAPTVSLTAPAAGATYTAPASVTITATAADSDGTVASVAFYNGSTLLATDTSSPYSYSWTNVAAGSYTLTARATDNKGTVITSAARTITVSAPNVAPTVSLTAPASGATYTAPASVTITATAADSDGTVASVAFYNGSTLLGTDTSAPYSYSWTNVAAGSYTLTARATDNKGAATTSASRTITVKAPTKTVTTYEAESAVRSSSVVVESNYSGYTGTGFVNFPANGGYIQFNNVNGGIGGTCTVAVRYALASGSRTGTKVVNGTTTSFTCDATGAWSTWVTVTYTATLTSGTTNTLRFNSTGSDLGNIDSITVTTP